MFLVFEKVQSVVSASGKALLLNWLVSNGQSRRLGLPLLVQPHVPGLRFKPFTVKTICQDQMRLTKN